MTTPAPTPAPTPPISSYDYHRDYAKALLVEAEQMRGDHANRLVATAQVHATLALAAATRGGGASAPAVPAFDVDEPVPYLPATPPAAQFPGRDH